ncbi:MAG: hypothetical protein V4663_04975 [Bacteroidota bacterium]
MDSIISLITLILAISLAGERLVTLIRTLIPALADDPNAIKSPKAKAEIVRKSIVMLLAFLCCWLTAFMVKDNMEVSTTSEFAKFPSVFLGLLASGGSAFWTSLLGYTKAARDIKVQQNQQEQISTNHKKSSWNVSQTEERINEVMSRISGLNAPSFSETSPSITNRI